jgi:hypothetical protein
MPKLSPVPVLLTIAALAALSVASGCGQTPNAMPAAGRSAADSASPTAEKAQEPARAPAAAPGVAVTVPFELSLGAPFAIDGVPGLQSYAWATANVEGTKWLLVGGLAAGVHGFGAEQSQLGQNFPASRANHQVLVVDPVKQQAWSSSLDALPASLAEPLEASSCAYCQSGPTLYIAGGYGRSSSAQTSGNMITFSTLTIIDVPGAIRAVMAGAPLAGSLQQISDPIFQVAGGSLASLNNQFYLCFGQTFSGLYSPVAGDPYTTFQQNYLTSVNVFQITAEPNPRVSFEQTIALDSAPGGPLRRRDFTCAPAIVGAGTPAIGIYGGVFSPEGFAAYFNPIYITGLTNPSGGGAASITPGLDKSFRQLLSQYSCPALPVFDPGSGDMHTLFFGGISAYWYNATAGTLVKDSAQMANGGRQIIRDGMPYISTISGLRRGADGTSTGYIAPVSLPGLMGASGEFLLDPATPTSANGVVQLDQISGPTRVGYLFGGIQSTGPYSTQAKEQPATTASNQWIPVTITPGPAQAIAMPAEPTSPGAP